MTTLIQPEPMTFRRLMRLAVVAALKQANLTVGGIPVDVESPGDWSFSQGGLPAIAVRALHDAKSSVAPTEPQFDTSTTIAVKAVVQATTAEAAQDALELLWNQVENTILKDYSVVGACKQVLSVDSEQEISSEGQNHLAGVTASFVFESYEVFDPILPDPTVTPWPVSAPPTVDVTTVTLDADLTNVFDPTATYPNPPFPSAVAPAPRTSGPDGRAEGGVSLTLPSS